MKKHLAQFNWKYLMLRIWEVKKRPIRYSETSAKKEGLMSLKPNTMLNMCLNVVKSVGLSITTVYVIYPYS